MQEKKQKKSVFSISCIFRFLFLVRLQMHYSSLIHGVNYGLMMKCYDFIWKFPQFFTNLEEFIWALDHFTRSNFLFTSGNMPAIDDHFDPFLSRLQFFPKMRFILIVSVFSSAFLSMPFLSLSFFPHVLELPNIISAWVQLNFFQCKRDPCQESEKTHKHIRRGERVGGEREEKSRKSRLIFNLLH